ncbi:hypothetical protein [Rhodocista pekingensis]|uniref:DUF5666 domain-containing protein n=1 Tax=Rhodocista pekingensis TaxID=201185 RepID=A0ABW2KTT8_9PROT
MRCSAVAFLALAALAAPVAAAEAPAKSCPPPGTHVVRIGLDVQSDSAFPGIPQKFATRVRVLAAPADGPQSGAGAGPTRGGPVHGVQIDTGSRGVLLPMAALMSGGQLVEGVEILGDGSLKYTSDDLILKGKQARVTLEIGLTDPPGGAATVTTTPIVVLAVEQTCPKNKPCTQGWDGGMMGIGFGRGPAPDQVPTPGTENAYALDNPLIAVQGMQVGGALQPAYTITKTELLLGQTEETLQGFTFVPLTRRSLNPPDWWSPPACITLGQGAAAKQSCGTMLLDTGITTMIVGLAEADRPAVPDGTVLTVTSPGPAAAGAAFSYSFTIGEPPHGAPYHAPVDPAQPMSPGQVRWGQPHADGAFVNTGIHPIAGYDYHYDAGCGQLGFRRH